MRISDWSSDVCSSDLVEPAARNTAPAIALAALAAVADDPAAMLLVMPADHVMTDVAAFLDAIEAARPAGVAGALATFGTTPSHPDTGYGSLAAGAPVAGSAGVHAVRPTATTQPPRSAEANPAPWVTGE